MRTFKKKQSTHEYGVPILYQAQKHSTAVYIGAASPAWLCLEQGRRGCWLVVALGMALLGCGSRLLDGLRDNVLTKFCDYNGKCHSLTQT